MLMSTSDHDNMCGGRNLQFIPKTGSSRAWKLSMMLIVMKNCFKICAMHYFILSFRVWLETTAVLPHACSVCSSVRWKNTAANQEKEANYQFSNARWRQMVLGVITGTGAILAYGLYRKQVCRKRCIVDLLTCLFH